LEKAVGRKISEEDRDPNGYVKTLFGLDSLGYQKLVLNLELRFGIEIPEGDGRSGFFSSVSGIVQYLEEYHNLTP
jgi:acyl carrier protein